MRLIPDQPVSSRQPRAGIALVVVLGFLSVLVIMAVSFAVFMRTERLASRAYLDVVRAKQLTHVALARAMSHINAELINHPDGFVVHPEWAEFRLVGTNYGMLATNQNEVYNVIPRAIYTNWAGPNGNAYRWLEVFDDPVQQTNLIGQVAFLSFNCSGLLDANWIGGSNRVDGSHPSQIPLDSQTLTELDPPRMSSSFTALRAKWVKFETPSELAVLTMDVITPNPWNQFVSNLFTYSRAPAGYWNVASAQVRDQVYVGEGFDPSLVRAEFVNMGFAAADADGLRDALIDYTDVDFHPQNVTSFTTEPTPLINEITIQHIMLDSTSQVCRPLVELWYPFVGVTNPHNYVLDMAIVFSGANPATINPRSSGRPAGQYRPPALTYNGPWTNPIFIVAGPSSSPSLPDAQGDDALPPVDLSGQRARIVARLWENAINTRKVDEVDITVDLTFTDANRVSAVYPSGPRTGGLSVSDPRLNYLPAQWLPTGEAPGAAGAMPTPGAINHANVTAPAAGDGLAATNIYIANRPLRTAGELGMLKEGATPWRTIRLLGPGALPVLDRFTVHTNRIRHGLINMNSHLPAVLNAAFQGARTEVWPGDPAGTSNNLALSTQWATALYNGGPYTNVADLRHNPQLLAIGGLTDLQREGVIRTTADLFTTRQQIFSLLLIGRSVDPNGQPLAEQRAYAIVWRDPFPNANGVHETFVRYFRPLQL